MAEQAPAGPMPGHDSDLIEQIRARWPAVLEETKKRNVTVRGLLNDGDVCGYENGVLTFGFRYQFHAERMMDGGNGQFLVVLQDVVRTLFGADIKVRCEYRPEVRGPGAQGGHLVKQALDLGGKVVEEGGNNGQAV